MPDRTDKQLRAWGRDLRAARRRRQALRGRFSSATIGITLLLATAIAPPKPRLLWNASASAPIGLYRIEPYAGVAKGDWVAAQLPAGMAGLADSRGYLPASVPVLKRVAAAAGDEVCAFGGVVFVNGRRTAQRRSRDAAGRPLPRWTGCHVLARDDLLLLNADAPLSFDGRYFGPTANRDLLGRAVPLWLG